jgi:predicted amidohydrolase YtcJ
MFQNKQGSLLGLAALILFLASLACGGDISPTLVGQVTTETLSKEQATATTGGDISPTLVGQVTTETLSKEQATATTGGDISPTLVGQVTTETSSEEQATATTEPDATEAPVEEPTGAPTEVGEVLTQVVYDHDHTKNGLLLDTGGDVDTEVVSVGSPPEQALRTGNGEVLSSTDGNRVEDYYMQFRIDDKFIFRGLPTSRVQIEIEYLDEGTDTFSIQYDAISGGPEGDGRFKDTGVVVKTDSGEFKTAVFSLCDAYFANRTNGGDFRIADSVDGAEIIRRVAVTLLTADMEVVQSPTEIPLSPPGLLPDDQASVIFHNGVILTMESGSVAHAIAVRDERILDVGSDKDMLVHAGPGTALIDLEGRTMMPGFVDPHSHVFANWQGNPAGAQNDIMAKGITAYAEMCPPESILHDIVEFERAGRLRLRVSLYPCHVDNCGNLLGSWYLEKYPATREPGAVLQIPGVKIFNDGGSCNVPATSFKYIGRADHGDLYLSVDELSAMIIEIQNNGYQAAIHSLGDRAIGVSQKAIAVALEGGPNTYRHRIEHNTILPDELLPPYSEYDIVATIFGYFPACSLIGDTSQYKYVTPPEFQDLEWRWRPLIDANPHAHISWHADSPPMGPEDPIKHLYGFVTRSQMQDDGTLCEPPDWAADDLLSVEEALPMMTIDAAYALHREDEIGSLKAGKLADLIILSGNPLEVDYDAILDIQVLMTMVGGTVEHCAQGQEALCP